MKTKIKGIQITGKLVIDTGKVIYVKDFEEMTIDSNKGSYILNYENLCKFVEQLNKI